MYNILTTTSRETLKNIKDQLAEQEPAALHSMMLQKEEKEAAKAKYSSRKVKETALCPPTCSGMNVIG